MCVIETSQLLREKGIKMVHINARSLYHKIEDAFTIFQVCDIIVITETWLNCSITTKSVSIEGLSVIRQDRHENSIKKGGGVSIYMLEITILMKYSILFVKQVTISPTGVRHFISMRGAI